MPLLGVQPSTASHAARGVGARRRARRQRRRRLCLAALAGLPPSPLFVSELMIALGGIQAGLHGRRGGRAHPARARLPRSLPTRSSRPSPAAGARQPPRNPPARRPVVGSRPAASCCSWHSPRAALALPGSAIARRARCGGCRERARRAIADYRDAHRPRRCAGGARLGSLYASRRGAAGRAHGAARSRTGALRIETRRRARRPRAEHRRPDAGRGVGRARSARSPRRRLRRPRAAASARRAHARRSRAGRCPVDGPDVYQVAVGPIHAGVIESGHFRFHVVGDRILHLDVRLFYKHRGLERAAVGVPLDDAIVYAARACGACAVTNRVAYAHAAEQPARAAADARGRAARARSCSSSNGSGATSTTSRRSAPASASRRATSASQRSARKLAGSMPHSPGTACCSTACTSEGAASRSTSAACRARATCSRACGADTTATWRELVFNTSFQDRLIDIGVLGARDATALGRRRPGGPCGRRRRGRARGATRAGLRTTASEPAHRASVRAATCARGSSSANSSSRRPSRCSTACSNAPIARGLLHCRRAPLRARRDAHREPARRHALRARAIGRARRPAPPAHRLVRELAGARRASPPATSCPISRSSTRASSSATPARTADMFTLLRDLRRLRLQHRPARASTRGRSLAIRHVDAGSCNGCEHELTLATSPLLRPRSATASSVVASPRHADLLLVTGAVTTRMHDALLTAYRAMPEPRRVAALGDCALGCGVLGLPEEIAGRRRGRPSGRPPHPRLPARSATDRRRSAGTARRRRDCRVTRARTSLPQSETDHLRQHVARLGA